MMRILRYELDGGTLTDGEVVVRNRIIRAGEWLFTVSAVDEDGGHIVMLETGDYSEAIMAGEVLSRGDKLPLVDRVVSAVES